MIKILTFCKRFQIEILSVFHPIRFHFGRNTSQKHQKHPQLQKPRQHSTQTNVNSTKFKKNQIVSKIKSLQIAYEEDDRQKCIQILTLYQQHQINQILQQELDQGTEQWLSFFSLKSKIHYKFRQYPHIHNCLNNQAQLLLKLSLAKDSIELVCELTNQYLLVLLLGDRARLRALLALINQEKKLGRDHKKKNQKQTWQQMIKFYQQIISKKRKPEDQFEATAFFHSFYICLICEAVVNSAPNALKKLILLTRQSNFEPHEHENIALTALTIIAYNSMSSKHPIPADNQKYINIFKQAVILKKGLLAQEDVSKICKIIISPPQVEQMVSLFIGERWETAKPEILSPFFKILFMAAENYHIIGASSHSERVIAALQHFLTAGQQSAQPSFLQQQCISHQLMLFFLKLTINFDKKQYQKNLELYPSIQEAYQRVLYSLPAVQLDIMQCYIYKIISSCYGRLNKKESSHEYETMALAFEAAFQVWTLLKIESSGDEQIDEAIGVKKGQSLDMTVPHYYFNLPFTDFFSVNWEEVGLN